MPDLEQSGAIIAGAVSRRKSGTSRKSAARAALFDNLRHVAKFAAFDSQKSAGIESVGGNAGAGKILDSPIDTKRKADRIVRYIYRNSPQKLADGKPPVT